MSVLYVVATPLGNLGDITLRALEILRDVNLILCEDTRVTKKLLEHYRINTRTLSYHQHSELQKVDYIITLLREGKNLALVSDAGTPAISDPGAELISKVYGLGFRVVSIPGPSALSAAVSLAGIAMNRFLFLGFPPAKKKRKKFFKEVAESKYPIIFYESPHRIVKTLKELSPSAKTVVCRELTKKFEQVLRGTAKEVLEQLSKDKIKGEFVVVVNRYEK